MKEIYSHKDFDTINKKFEEAKKDEFSDCPWTKFIPIHKDISKDIDFITPTSARSKVKFKKSGKGIKGSNLKKEIINYINIALGTKIKQEDIADAIVLALAGMVK